MWNCTRCRADIDFEEVEKLSGSKGAYFVCPYCAKMNSIADFGPAAGQSMEPSSDAGQ